MAKEIHKRISVWLNQQGIENNLKSVRTVIKFLRRENTHYLKLNMFNYFCIFAAVILM